MITIKVSTSKGAITYELVNDEYVISFFDKDSNPHIKIDSEIKVISKEPAPYLKEFQS